MPYQSLACPFCQHELLDKQTVEFIATETAEGDHAGTAIVVAECLFCCKKTGIVVASDSRNWAILAVLPEMLSRVHQCIKELLEMGMPLGEIVQRISGNIPTTYAS